MSKTKRRVYTVTTIVEKQTSLKAQKITTNLMAIHDSGRPVMKHALHVRERTELRCIMRHTHVSIHIRNRLYLHLYFSIDQEGICSACLCTFVTRNVFLLPPALPPVGYWMEGREIRLLLIFKSKKVRQVLHMGNVACDALFR